MKDGILNINKPQEMTSFDVVAILRKKLGVKRMGHLGTLDPMAEGVLPIAIGKAARIMDYLGADMKEYMAEFVFGISTDTDDLWGNIISQDTECHLTKESVENCMESFMGVIDQVPPKYSALKVDGRKLYDYARAGQDVEIKSRRIYIESIDVLDFGKRKVHEVDDEFPFVALRILCSKGTYIRSIARDMGEKLGTCATMSGLMRTRSGAFRIGDAIRVDDIREMEAAEIEKFILDMDCALETFPVAKLGEWEEHLFKNGVKLEAHQWEKDEAEIETEAKTEASCGESSPSQFADAAEGNAALRSFPLELPEVYFRTYRVYGNSGFIGLGTVLEDGGLKAEKVLV